MYDYILKAFIEPRSLEMQPLDVLMSVAESELNFCDREFEQSSLFTDESMIDVSLDDLRLEEDNLKRLVKFETFNRSKVE